MHIETFVVGPLATNSYLITNRKTNEAVVIDPGARCPRLEAAIAQVELTAILLTHAHFDHIGGVEHLAAATAAPVWIHELEAEWLADPRLNLSAAMAPFASEIQARPDRTVLLAEQSEASVGGLNIKTIHTPGHTPGHVIYLIEGVAFVGDLIFQRSVGRTDFPGGNSQTLLTSIRRHILSLPGTTRLWPGHGAATSVEEEKEHNPYLS